jgi:5'-phosphate synthase pdxT subunit
LTELKPHIGVLAIQGDYERHAAALEESGARASLVKTPEELRLIGQPEGESPDGEPLDGLILPGGESTTMLNFLNRNHFFETLKAFAQQKPVFGTCAGAILLASEVRHPSQPSLGILSIAVERNAYGVQRDSAILSLDTTLPGGPLETVFIRAPRIVSVLDDADPKVEILAQREGFPVLIRQGRTMAATFHPELSSDRRVHQLFVNLVEDCKAAADKSGPAIAR